MDENRFVLAPGCQGLSPHGVASRRGLGRIPGVSGWEALARVLAVVPVLLHGGLHANIIAIGPGALNLDGSAAVSCPGGFLRIQNEGGVRLESGSSLAAASVEVKPTGKLFNCGAIDAVVSNEGEIVARCGQSSTFLKAVTNSGVFRVSHGSVLMVTGVFNNLSGGLLDMITATQTGPPPGLVNSGVVMEAKDVQVKEVVVGVTDVEVVIQGVPPHTYQLMGNRDLSPAGWVAIGTPVIASGGPLRLRHPGAAGDFRRYSYRVLVGD